MNAGGWVAYRAPRRGRLLHDLGGWLAERFRRHRGNADVVRQDLARERGIVVSLRTVERALRSAQVPPVDYLDEPSHPSSGIATGRQFFVSPKVQFRMSFDNRRRNLLIRLAGWGVRDDAD